ncbi:MAG: ribulose 1,5-bisphosphate carboxylase [Gammaproteobacteria bacterium]|nr:ribulose 1,5-bisphosphate carboxylase [Gammaproteobacteria bacterium]
MTTFSAIYHVTSNPAEIDARAAALALEQSVEMPATAICSDYVRQHTLGQVAQVAALDAQRFRVVLTLQVATTGAEPGQLMNMLFGNCSLQEDVQLVDVDFPAALLREFPGPRFGIAGIRRLLEVPERALTCTALKPQGLSPSELAALCVTFARAGIDVIKDDHGIADQAYAPFAARVRACQRGLNQVARDTGQRACYAPSLSGGPRQLREQLDIVANEGVGMVLVAPMIMGLPVFHELVREHFQVPVLAHPALSGALRIAPPLFYGKLFRLFGADAVIFPNFGGRFSFSRETCHALVHAARMSWGDCASALPVPAGGMSVERVPEMIEAYGLDTMLLIGGGLLSAGDALARRCQEFVTAVAVASTAHV